MKDKKAMLAPVKSAVYPVSAETAEQRVRRLYSHQGGPLIGWLFDEARRRGLELQEMAAELGVTYGYVSQLRTGIRRTSQISHDFASACGEFLGVPTVVVLLLAGYLTMSDFAVRAESDEQMVERALRQMMDDSHVRSALPVDAWSLPTEAKRALVLMYAESSGQDVFGLRGLSSIVRWLQRAAEQHDENEGAAVRCHRDVSDRSE